MVLISVIPSEAPAPRIFWLEGFAVVEIQPGVSVHCKGAEFAENLRDAFAAVVEGFSVRDANWVSGVEEDEWLRNDEPVAVDF